MSDNTLPTIALLGGTFDPIHMGHLSIARVAMSYCNLDQCLFIPCHTPVHKAPAKVSTEHRLNMLKLALASEPHCSIDPCEIEIGRARYTLETLQAIRHKHPHHALTFIMGADGGRTLTKWHHWQKLLEQAHLLIMPRDHDRIDLAPELKPYLQHDPRILAEKPHGSVLLLQTHMPFVVSSTHIRRLIATKQWQVIEPLLPKPVLHYIQKHDLYSQP